MTIPKGELRADDILVDGELPDNQCVGIDKLDRRAYLIRFPEDGSLPPLSECDAVRRVAAEIALSKDPNRISQPAD
ncbi:hypothetical protein GWK26_08635 [haloarchaeon 3A1-DGR]|nr:hypothetical protein GWK26_08635 [haloarchaeon 3A1-DGR]